MPLLKFKRQDLFSFLSSNGVNEKIIELLRRLSKGDFDGLFTDQYNARHFRATVYDQCTDTKNKFRCTVIVYPDYVSFIVWAPNGRVYEVVVGVNDDGLLFSNIVRMLDLGDLDKRDFKRNLPSKKWRWGEYDLFGVGNEVAVYSVGSLERIHKLFGYDEELTQPVSVIDVSNRKVVRVQGDRTLIVEPLDANSFLDAMKGEVGTYMRYLWIDTLLFTFVNNHITAHPDRVMNIVVRRFFFSSAPWVDASKIDPEPIWSRALDFLARWLQTTANIYATQAQLDGSRDASPTQNCWRITRIYIISATVAGRKPDKKKVINLIHNAKKIETLAEKIVREGMHGNVNIMFDYDKIASNFVKDLISRGENLKIFYTRTRNLLARTAELSKELIEKASDNLALVGVLPRRRILEEFVESVPDVGKLPEPVNDNEGSEADQ